MILEAESGVRCQVSGVRVSYGLNLGATPQLE